jgi:hypothetical protein
MKFTYFYHCKYNFLNFNYVSCPKIMKVGNLFNLKIIVFLNFCQNQISITYEIG